MILMSLLTGDPITICTSDDIDEPIDVVIDDAGIGTNGAWVITDSNGIILDLPAGPPFTLDGAGPGTCLIWWVNFDDPNFAPAVGDDAAALVAAATCAALSNPITVNRDDNCGTMVTIVNIEDPCGCDLPANIDLDGDGVVDLFYEEITITAIAGIADWVANFTMGSPLDATGAATTPSIIDNGDGTYTIGFYLAASDMYTVDFNSASEGLMTGISGGGCTPCTLCEDSIAGSVTAEDIGCSVDGIEVTIYDATGAVIGTATTDASGNYALMGLYPCGSYTAELTANVPDCYTVSGGTTGPIGFEVDGDGTADGANFTENPQIPTLSQWGLISLALLLMIIGSLKMSATQVTLQRFRVK